MLNGFPSQSSTEFRHSGVSVTQTQRVKLLCPACHTNTKSQATMSGMSHKHKESSYWVRPVTQTQIVKALCPACHTHAESQGTLSGLSHKHRESKHWAWPVTNTDSQGTVSGMSHKRRESRHWAWPVTQTQRFKALVGLVYITESHGTGSGLSYKRDESTRHRVGPVIHSRSTGSALSHKCRLR